MKTLLERVKERYVGRYCELVTSECQGKEVTAFIIDEILIYCIKETNSSEYIIDASEINKCKDIDEVMEVLERESPDKVEVPEREILDEEFPF